MNSVLFTTKQFRKLIELKDPSIFVTDFDHQYFNCLDMIDTQTFDLSLNYILIHNKKGFQRFLNEKSFKLTFPEIDLDDLKRTCCTKCQQSLLLLSLLFYLV